MKTRKRQPRLEHFIQKSLKQHDYIYDDVELTYTTSGNPCAIRCKEHGKFTPTVSNHIHCKSGCPQCAIQYKPGGYMFTCDSNAKQHCILYIIECWDSAERFYL